MSLTLASSTSTTALPEKWVERLFERMLLDYGKKFGDQWAQTDMDTLIAHWSRELAGYSGAELKRGLDALATREWPPTLPEFKKLCRRPLDPMHAYYEAVAGVQARAAGEYGKWSHPAIYWAAMPLTFDLGNQTYSQIKARWEAALFEQLDKGEWPEIPQPMAALPAPGKAKTSREDASRILRELGAATIVKDFRGGDGRAWAKKLLAREAAGEKLTLLQASMAREALAAG
jgi:hypothetical protein